MGPTDYIFATLAALGGLLGLALLYSVWRKPGRPVMLVVGWALVLSSLLVWFMVNMDRGVAQIASILMLVVAGLITWPGLLGTNGMHAPIRIRTIENTPPQAASIVQKATAVGSGIWTFLLAGPVAGVISFYAGGALLRVTVPETGNPANAAVGAFLFSLVAWALLSTLLLMEQRKLRRTLYALGACAVALAAAFI